MDLRRAQPKDALPIASLLDEPGYRATGESIAAKLAMLQTGTDDGVLIAVNCGRVSGCISLHAVLLFHASGKLGRITSFVVAPHARDSGVGAAMLGAARCWFEGAGCEKFEVTSGDRRAGAHRFDESRACRRDGQRILRGPASRFRLPPSGV